MVRRRREAAPPGTTGVSRNFHRLLAVVLATAVTLAVAEILVRLVEPSPFRPTAVEDEHLSDVTRPDFRDRVYRLEKDPGTFRILAVGDSFTWGDGVLPEDTYADRLARQLERLQPGRKFEVINWSRPGWNTHEAWRSLRDADLEWHEDLLLVGYVLNDAEPSSQAERAPLHRRIAPRAPGSALSLLLYRHSRLFARLFDAVENLRRRVAIDRFYRGLYEGDTWEDAKRSLWRLRRMARADGAQTVVVIFPVFDPRLGPDYPYRELHDRVASAAEEMGIPALDLLPQYEGMDPRRLAVNPFADPHPDELAHRIAADAIARFLVREKLLQRKPPGPGGGRPAAAEGPPEPGRGPRRGESPHPL